MRNIKLLVFFDQQFLFITHLYLSWYHNIFSLEDMVQRVDDSQSIWTIENTRDTIWAEKQRKVNGESQRKGDGTPIVDVKAPDKKTVHGYHTALLSTPQIAHKVAKPEVIRVKPGPKPRNGLGS